MHAAASIKEKYASNRRLNIAGKKHEKNAPTDGWDCTRHTQDRNRCSPAVNDSILSRVTLRYLAVGLEVSLDVFNGRGRRQTTHEHLLGPRHHLTLITVT